MIDPNRKAEKAAKQAAEKLAYEREVIGLEFEEWPKISRLNRDIIITEKIDGTNAAVGIKLMAFAPPAVDDVLGLLPDQVIVDGMVFRVYAQSRNRIVTPGNDNYGFAAWVRKHAAELAHYLGEGLHFGEWWGVSIARNYGLTERRFSLFNTMKWEDTPEGALALANLRLNGVAVYTVPTLYRGPWSDGPEHTFMPDVMLAALKQAGSVAAPDFAKPEGIVVFHRASGMCFKATCENDEQHKGEIR